MGLRLITALGMLWITPAAAALYTVGAGGTHASIQDAIDAALAAPGADEIRIAAGTYVENLSISPSGSGNLIEMSGGWDPTFSSKGTDPSVIDGNATGRVADISLDIGDSLTLENLRFRNGAADPAAGLLITQYGDSVLQISDCEIVDNTADSDRSSAAGLRVSVNETSQFTLVDSLVAGNQSICSGTVDCREGGMGLQAANESQATISRNEFSNNSVQIGSGSAFVGGALLFAYDSSSLLVEDNRFVDNTISGSTSAGYGTGLAIAGDGGKTARRNYVDNNLATLPAPQNYPQMSVFQWGSGTSVVTDSVVVNGNTQGFAASTSGDAGPTIHVVNLTVADNAGKGIRIRDNGDSGTLTLSNSIAVDNGENADLGVGVVSTNNRIGGSAGFVDAAAGDYALSNTSPAIDAGANAPPGGLGPTDIEGHPRINNGTVDQGAHEFQSDVQFTDGFESTVL